ncbi:hypothetical protein JT06_12780 [Desulfobulbus sp. Tol-SR]|nr:hypothetical protein JT06_12780 [Desulfobulbus sp. Tol-SR]
MFLFKLLIFFFTTRPKYIIFFPGKIFNTGKLTWEFNILFKIIHIFQGRLFTNVHIKSTKNLFDSFILFVKFAHFSSK